MLLILTQYQNCAPQQQVKSTTFSDSEVRIIDDWSNQKIALLDSRVELQTSATEVNIDGLCKRTDKSSLSWKLNNQSDQTLEQGLSPCEMGGFRMVLDRVESLTCGEDYLLEVEHPSGEVGSLWLSRKCAPESSLPIQNLNGDSECYLEMVQVEGSNETKCEQVCYTSSKVTFKKDLNMNQCPQLQAQVH